MFKANQLFSCQQKYVDLWHKDETAKIEEVGFLNQVITQHRFNYDLWHFEDKARDRDATDAVIADVKRNIDRCNQQRQNNIELLDESIIGYLTENNTFASNCPLNSETPGSIIDRLSISALKTYHMHEEVVREDATDEHKQKCSQKLDILKQQSKDLQKCLDELLIDLISQKKSLKVYRQMKMYNDVTLNPQLYKKMSSHDHYMQLAYEQSKIARGKTGDNPAVGCVIVMDGVIIASGYTGPPSKDHAEASAIHQALKSNLDLTGCTLYTTLEPCTFVGKTPACSDLIVSIKPKTVVIGVIDPHPKVNKKAIKQFEDAGIEVICGVLKETISMSLREWLEQF